jgi:hypothetical protein
MLKNLYRQAGKAYLGYELSDSVKMPAVNEKNELLRLARCGAVALDSKR